jgi:hypothetical protein
MIHPVLLLLLLLLLLLRRRRRRRRLLLRLLPLPLVHAFCQTLAFVVHCPHFD